jgi:hypothetical protein
VTRRLSGSGMAGTRDRSPRAERTRDDKLGIASRDQ